jgi:diguanylate cyclase (GGDEF)-like protein
VSNSVLAGIFFFIAAFMTFRGLYFLGFASPTVSLLDASNWLNLVTPLLLAVLPVVGTTAFLLMCSERIRRQWEMAAATDYLTALPNRRTIMGTGEARFNAARRAATPFAVAVLDIDHFKSINDRFGHAVGDQALKHVAKVLTVACRGPNMVGRHGGEEFVALLEGATVAEARLAGERLRRAIEDEAFVAKLKNGGQTLALTVSVGVATLGAKDGLFEDLLGRADQALYAAKENGRNRVEASAPEALPSA